MRIRDKIQLDYQGLVDHGPINIVAFGERVARNSPIQGNAADVIKLAMIAVHKKLAESDLDARLILQVHDELIVECAERDADAVAALLKDCMESAVSTAVLLRADVAVGKTWPLYQHDSHSTMSTLRGASSRGWAAAASMTFSLPSALASEASYWMEQVSFDSVSIHICLPPSVKTLIRSSDQDPSQGSFWPGSISL